MSTFAKKVTSAVLASAVVLTAVGSTAGVNAAYTNLDAANKLANLDVIVDQSANPSAYRLADTISRQEALKIMMKLSGKTVNEGSCTSPFADIADSDWACKYAVAALEAGFIAANTNFRPHDEVSKIEGLKMVMQARGIERDNTADWREGYVTAAVAKGIATPFSDYNTSVERGLMFVWAAEAVAPMEEEEDDDLLGSLLGDLTDEEEDTNTDEEEVVVEEEEDNTEEEVVVSGDDMLTVSLNPETPSDGLAQAGTDRVSLLVFDVTAGSEDVTLNELTLDFIGLGDYNNLDNVGVYNSMGERVSKQKDFSELTREISFDRDIVVEAGMTMTLTVAGKISTDGNTNSTYGVKLVDIKASSDVEGEDLIGALLVPATFSNVATLRVDQDKATGDVTIGENMVLAGFEIEEVNDNEDVILKTVTIHFDGSVDEDDISDLSLEIDGEEVASDLMVNSDDEIVAALDYNLAADEKVAVELKGTVTGSVGDSIDFKFEGNDDIYAIGATSGMPVTVTSDDVKTAATSTTAAVYHEISNEDIADLNNVEGAEINIAFDKSDVDEAKPDAEEVSVGTVRMTASSDNYEVTKLEVRVTGDGASYIDDLELGGSSYDSLSGTTYTFEDIVLPEGEEVALELTMDVKDDAAANNKEMTFEVVVTEIEDDVNDVTYTENNSDDDKKTSKILSTTSLNKQTIDIESAGVTISSVQVNERELVLGNGIETVLYKGKISVSDADDVVIEDFDFATGASVLNGEDLDDVIANATLNIGGQTFDADIDSNSVDFSNINAVIAAGSDNVEVLVTGILKDNDNITGTGKYIELIVDTSALTLEDSDSDPVANQTITAINSKKAKTTLLDRGQFTVKIVKNGELKDDIDETVLAGSENVALAEVEIQAEYENIDVEALTFKITSAKDYSDSLLNVDLVAADGTVIASDAVLSYSGGATEILFEDFTVADSDDVVDAKLVADLRAYDTTGDVTTGQLGDIVVTVDQPTSADLEGENSNDPITPETVTVVAGETISIVPALVTVSISDTLGTDDKYATLEFTIDQGNNEFDNDKIVVTQVEIETAVSGSGVTVRNDDNTTVASAQTTTTVAITNTDGSAEITSGDEYEFKVSTDNAELRIVPKGISYTLDGSTYTTNNDDVLNLGEYNESN